MEQHEADAILKMEMEVTLQNRVRELIIKDSGLMEHIIQNIRNRMVNDRSFAIQMQKFMASIISSNQLY